MDEIRLRAYAKVNLGLDVLRRREDGYHDVRMIMQNINLFDKLTRKKQESISVRICHTFRQTQITLCTGQQHCS